MSLCELFNEKAQSKHYICGTKFAFEDVTHKTINDYVFEDVILNSIDFTGTHFVNVKFVHCTIKKGLFCKADLYNVTFEECKILETDMTYATGKNIMFEDSVVQETDLSGVKLFETNAIDSTFDDCYCHHSVFIDGKFGGCTISGLDSLAIYLEGTEMVDCENNNSNIEEIKLQNTLIRRT